jgi:hypothetical protein
MIKALRDAPGSSVRLPNALFLAEPSDADLHFVIDCVELRVQVAQVRWCVLVHVVYTAADSGCATSTLRLGSGARSLVSGDGC